MFEVLVSCTVFAVSSKRCSRFSQIIVRVRGGTPLSTTFLLFYHGRYHQRKLRNLELWRVRSHFCQFLIFRSLMTLCCFCGSSIGTSFSFFMPEATKSLLAYCFQFDGSGGKRNVQLVFSRKWLYVVF